MELRLPINREQATAGVNEAHALVQDYCATDAVKAVASMLDALVEYYRVVLETAEAADVAGLQAAVRQCKKLRDSLPVGSEPPKIF